MERTLKSFCAVALLTVGVAACGSSSKPSSNPSPSTSTSPSTASSAPVASSAPTTTPAAATGPTITIGTPFAFTTHPVAAGAMVTVKNTSAAQHTVSADTTEGGFDITVDAGQTTTFRAPAKPGSYTFHCNIHTFMKGTLDVT